MRANLALVIALAWTVSASAITIETVPVGDVGNPSIGGLGRVDYAYNISKYEVTVGQYTAFLNAVAAIDTYNLYNPSMATDLNIAGIARTGSSPNYTYSVIGSPNHPITYVGWGDAIRFVNWLSNGQPTGPQNNTTTEDGAYMLNGATNGEVLESIFRKANAKWFIPTLNEWYKAAYYQPAEKGGDADNYWNYPMKTNSVPYSDQPPGATPDDARVGNFYQDDTVANGYDDGYAVTGSSILSAGQNYLTEVGAYISSPSFYGTFDQGGNVSEWTDFAGCGFGPCGRYVGGGSWNSRGSISIRAGGGEPVFLDQSGERDTIGFRVATIVPEPSTLLLTIPAFAALLNCGRRSVHRNRV